MSDVYQIMGEAALLVQPSECYETFGRVAIEAFAKATPVVASDQGAVAELVAQAQVRAGVLFKAGDPDDLARKVDGLLSDPLSLGRMRRQARQEFEAKYTATRNYEQLMAIYRQAMTLARSKGNGET
jgi:glycosyltransferase involved in cell wall biosynthesis